MAPDVQPPRATRHVAVVGLAVAIAAVTLWWVWPALFSDADDIGLLVLDDGSLADGRRALELRAREEGRTVRWAPFTDSWCDDPGAAAATVDDVDPDRVVVSSTASPVCVAAVAAALEARRPILVVPPGEGPAASDATAGVVIVDPERLVGQPGDGIRATCLWWEQCDGDGAIAVRDESGALTAPGHERIARMIVAAL